MSKTTASTSEHLGLYISAKAVDVISQFERYLNEAIVNAAQAEAKRQGAEVVTEPILQAALPKLLTAVLEKLKKGMPLNGFSSTEE